MKTASFFTYFGEGRVSIARATPRKIKPGYKVYRNLAPGPWFNSVTRPQYEKLYFAQLAKLNAQDVAVELEALVAPHEPVLLCWERPPFTADNWCHRSMLADWFKREAGIVLLEIGGHPHAHRD
jgi:hypothetical protein